MIARALLLAWLLLFVACSGEHRAARTKYNEGLAALDKAEYEPAEKLFLEARSTAGVDPELRFRAAYQLGVAFAEHAGKMKAEQNADLNAVLALAQQSASWFADAARLRPTDADTQTNLAIVRARVQAISDELREAEGKLEARLDALIGSQRAVLDDARRAWAQIALGGGVDPLAQQSVLAHLADRERGIVAEAGVIADLAADEIDAIGKKEEDKREDSEKMRLVQLKNLDLYLLDARNRIADARRKLQELAAEEGVTKAEAALVALKRGREQLLDPIVVLRSLAQDQAEMMGETELAAASAGGLTTERGAVPPPEKMPQWLAPAAIGTRQGTLRDRLEEIRARLSAGAESPPPPPSQDPQQAQQQAQMAKMIERVKAALPSVGQASEAMQRASSTLGGGKPRPALDEQRAALFALAAAIEQFSDLKQVIELAYGDQTQLVRLLGPEAATVEKRAEETKSALARNVLRMPRLKELLAEAAAQPAPPLDPKADDKAKEAHAQAAEQQKQMYVKAEQLRGEAEAKLAALEKAIAAASDPLAPAKEAEAKLAELRRLFFSVIEHLQQLVRDQGETRDKTSAANGEDMFGREAKLPPLVTTQEQHDQMAKAIIDALAAQADAAAKQAQPQPGQPDAKALSGAASEVRLASQAMADVIRELTKARDDKAASHSLDPATTAQGTAIEHLEAALRLLQPPQDQKQNDQQDQKQDEPQDQKQDQQPQQSSGGAGQRARDEDAKRQKARMQQGGDEDGKKTQAQGAPVEKDW